MSVLLKGGSVVLPDCSGFITADVLVEDDRIAKIGEGLSGEESVDVSGKYLLPGLIDVHNHGSIGVYFGSDEDNKGVLRFLASRGVTTVIPTLSTQTIDVLIKRIKTVLSYREVGEGEARIGGIHLEGPFISDKRRGAMAAEIPDCTVENFVRLIEAGEGNIKLMTLAPERENALDVIKEGVRRGVRMSLGHTIATYREAMAGIEAGACHATHTFNAMREYNHREPGVLGAVLLTDSVMCEVIADMVHLAPPTVELIRRLKGVERMILVSDSVLITGMPDGEYVYDGQIRIVKDGVSRTQSGTIAGSCFTMADGAKRLVENGFSLADVARVGAKNPAVAMGLDSEIGTLEIGKIADVLVCDGKMNVERVMLRGKIL